MVYDLSYKWRFTILSNPILAMPAYTIGNFLGASELLEVAQIGISDKTDTK